MKTLVLIGGGNIIDHELDPIIIKAINRIPTTNKKVCILPTASHDDQGYAKRLKQYFRTLHCDVKALRLWHTKKSIKEIHDELLTYDLIFIGGGDSDLLMEGIHQFELTQVFQQAYDQGIVLVGYSAGSNALCTYGYSDGSHHMHFMEGMNLLTGCYCPHAQNEDRIGFYQEVEKYHLPIYACKDHEAIFVEDDIITKINL